MANISLSLIGKDDGKTYNFKTQDQADEAFRSGAFIEPAEKRHVYYQPEELQSKAPIASKIEEPVPASFEPAIKEPEKEIDPGSLPLSPLERPKPSQEDLALFLDHPIQKVSVPGQPPLPDQKREFLERAGQEEERQKQNIVIPEENYFPDPQVSKLTEPVDINNKQVQTKSAQEQFPDFPLVGLDDGKIYPFKNDAKGQQALKTGSFRYSTKEERDQRLLRQNVQNIEDEISQGDTLDAVNAGLKSMVQPLVSHPESNDATDNAYEDAFREEDAKRHPTATTIGKIARQVPILAASEFGVGEALEAAEIDAAASLFSKAGLQRAAIETAVYGAPDAMEAMANEDPKGAAEALALAGVGVLGAHGIAKGLGAIAGGIEKGAAYVSARSAESIAFNDLAKEVGIAAKDTEAEALAKVSKFREANASIKAGAEDLDKVENSSLAASEAAQKVRAEVEELIPQRHLALEEQKAKITAIETELKAKPSLEGLQDLEAAKAELRAMPRTTPVQKEAIKKISPILDELKNASSFSDMKALQETTARMADKDPRGVGAKIHKALVEHLTAAEGEIAKLNPDPKMADALRLSQNLDKLADRIKTTAATEAAKEGGLGFHLPSNESLMHNIIAPSHLSVTHLVGSTIHRNIINNIMRSLKGSAAARRVLASVRPMTDTVVHTLANASEVSARATKGFFKTLDRSVVRNIAAKTTISSLLPDNGKGLSKQNQLAELRSMVNANLENPETFANNISHITGPMKEEGLHRIADEYTQHQLRLMKVIQTFMPKGNIDELNQLHPFAAKVPVSVSDIDKPTIDRFERVLTIAHQPEHLLELVKSNSITQGDVAIAAACNPVALAKMRDALTEEALKSKPDLTYQQRLSVGILMGKNLDDSTDTVVELQSAYPPSSSIPGQSKKSGKMNSKSAETISQSALTTSQLAAGH